ncbi:MAG: hypothetical protein JEY94_05260 [Melioribacteraceae bacterium]|nr:hypothetical protein [Melioribacteraceae bacterium]
MYKILCLIILIGLACCGKGIEKFPQTEIIPDGIYLVLDEFEIDYTPNLENDSLVIINYSDLVDENENSQLLLDKYKFVPLSLMKKPVTQDQEDGRKKLLLELTDTANDRLKFFTEKCLNREAAIVIGNRAMTVHKVRSVIEDGKLQITGCTDNACEVLYMELKDNIIGMPK